MKRTTYYLKLLSVFLLVSLAACIQGCASTPSLIIGQGTDATGKPTAAPPIPIKNATIVTDLQSAAYNLDNAIAVGALPAGDPAAACIHGVLIEAGIEIPPGATAAKSFAPKNDGLVSLGAINYILIQQKNASPGVVVPQTCKTVIGQFVIDGMAMVNKLGAGLILKGL